MFLKDLKILHNLKRHDFETWYMLKKGLKFLETLVGNTCFLIDNFKEKFLFQKSYVEK